VYFVSSFYQLMFSSIQTEATYSFTSGSMVCHYLDFVYSSKHSSQLQE